MNNKTDDTGTTHDEQLTLEVEKALLAGTLRGIVVEARAGSVVLSGRLPSFYLKQLAQVNAMKVDGVLHLRNRIRVRRLPRQDEPVDIRHSPR